MLLNRVKYSSVAGRKGERRLVRPLPGSSSRGRRRLSCLPLLSALPASRPECPTYLLPVNHLCISKEQSDTETKTSPSFSLPLPVAVTSEAVAIPPSQSPRRSNTTCRRGADPTTIQAPAVLALQIWGQQDNQEATHRVCPVTTTRQRPARGGTRARHKAPIAPGGCASDHAVWWLCWQNIVQKKKQAMPRQRPTR